MALAELKTVEFDAIEFFKTILESDSDVQKYTHRQVIELTELPEIIPVEADFPLIQLSDPSINFDTSQRSTFTEFPSIYLDVHCYNYVKSNELGSTFTGEGSNVGLFKLVGSVIAALHGKSDNKYYWVMLVGISKGRPVQILDVTEEKEDADLVFMKTVTFELRKKIMLV